MTTSPNDPTLDDVLETHEHPHPDRREHAKQAKHPDEAELAERTDLERSEVEAVERSEVEGESSP